MDLFEPLRVPLALKHLLKINKSNYSKYRDLQLIQTKYLKTQLLNAWENEPYYHKLFKKLNIGQTEILKKPYHSLARLPILTKETLRDNYKDLISKKKSWINREMRTSGTTGIPIKILIDLHQWSHELAFVLRAYGNAGYNIAKKMIVLRSYDPKTPNELIKFNTLNRFKLFSAFHLSNNTLDYYIREMKSFKTQFIRSYPSTLQLLADLNPNIDFLKVGFTGSEVLSSNARNRIKSKLNIELFDWYGLVEQNVTANECNSHDGLHMNMEYGLFEFETEDKEINSYESGSKGIIIGTSFHNYSFPLLRYKTGDYAFATETGICSCGRSSPRIRNIGGRESQLITVGKTKKAATHLYSIIREYDSVNQFKLTKKRNTFILQFTGSLEEDLFNKCKQDLDHFLESDVELEKLEAFEPSKSKFKVIDIN